MAQTMIAFYCFNDNNVSSVKDFSVNERHSASTTALTIASYAYSVGKTCKFNGTTSNINFGNITAFNSLTAFTIVTKIRLTTTGVKQVISFRSSSHGLEVTSADKIKFTINNGADISLTDTRVLVTETWYTIIAMWDGVNMSIYIDALDTPFTGAMTGTMASNSNSLVLGYDTVDDWFAGYIEMISYYSRSLTDDEILTVLENPTGMKMEAIDGSLKTGDLILNNASGKEVVSWYEEFDERLFSDGEEHNFNDEELIIFKN